MRNGPWIKSVTKKAPDPLVGLDKITSTSAARRALGDSKRESPEVQEKIQAHVKENFPDVLIDRRR